MPTKSKSSLRKSVEKKLATKPATGVLIKSGATKRRSAGLPRKLPTDLGKEIGRIAGKHNVVIEWTVKPLGPSPVAACACVCSWVCTCYAMPGSHGKVRLNPSVIGRQILEKGNLDLGVLVKKK